MKENPAKNTGSRKGPGWGHENLGIVGMAVGFVIAKHGAGAGASSNNSQREGGRLTHRPVDEDVGGRGGAAGAQSGAALGPHPALCGAGAPQLSGGLGGLCGEH